MLLDRGCHDFQNSYGGVHQKYLHHGKQGYAGNLAIMPYDFRDLNR
jgi:hypothetical protein